MDGNDPGHGPDENTGSGVTVRFWASAKAATGVASEQVDAATLGHVLDDVRARHGASVARVLQVASYLVDEQPVSGADPADVRLRPGQVVDVLPPFAGGATLGPSAARPARR